MFGCVLENTVENTFFTCCSHFLTFSRLPNEYIISFIPQNTNKTQKKIIKSGQTKARSRSAQSALHAIVIDASCDRDRSFMRSRSKLRAITIGAFTLSRSTRSRDRNRSFVRSRSGSTRSRNRDRHGASHVDERRGAGDVAISSFFLPLSLSLSSTFQGRKSFEVKMETKMIFHCFGSEIRSTGNAFHFDRI